MFALLARLLLVTFVYMAVAPSAWALEAAAEMLMRYHSQVVERLEIPAPEIPRYARLAEDAFRRAGTPLSSPQYVLVVDRDPNTQASFLFWRSETGTFILVGASPVSTGQPGQPGDSNHYETPLGVFEHSTVNRDFRSDGAANRDGIRIHGAKGLRVFDFGWQRVPKGWGDGTQSRMRLLMHATDPDLLERRLGSAQSNGGVHISASLDRLLDHYGVLDAGDDQAEGRGSRALRGREPVPHAGRYLVVVDSARTERPGWSPAPFLPHRKPTTPALR